MNAAINGHPDAKSRMLMLNEMLEQVSASKQTNSAQKTAQNNSESDGSQTANEQR